MIIPFRNEIHHLEQRIASLKEQEYPHELCQFVFVDDHSDDSGNELVKACLYDKRFQLLFNDTDEAGKKSAIDKAVRIAQSEIIVVTDADCVCDKQWLNCLVSSLNAQCLFSAGPVFIKDPESFGSRIQQAEMILLQYVTAKCIFSKYPMMANGANMAFNKAFYLKSGGFERDNRATGDDFYLLQKAGENVNYALHQDAYVYTLPALNMQHYFSQRKRWAVKAADVKGGIKLIIGFAVWMSHTAPIVFILIGLIKNAIIPWIFPYVLKVSIDVLLLSLACFKFRLKAFPLAYLTACLIYPFVVLITTFMMVKRGYSWKTRNWKR
ncbi:MAG: glycosyltransferase [Bacteroidia bacterium]